MRALDHLLEFECWVQTVVVIHKLWEVLFTGDLGWSFESLAYASKGIFGNLLLDEGFLVEYCPPTQTEAFAAVCLSLRGAKLSGLCLFN